MTEGSIYAYVHIGEDLDLNEMDGISCETEVTATDITTLLEELHKAKQQIQALKEQLCNSDARLKEVTGGLLISDFEVFQNQPIVLKHFTDIYIY